MNVLIENVSAEIVEKKSRFIADLYFISSEEEATKKLDEIRKKYYDAKHHCFAYITGEKQEIVKSSDDGEPQGTAGHPILDILKGFDLTNVIAIVTRYFGGTLLGTGGLVASYSGAVKEALSFAKFAEVTYGIDVSFSVDYDNYNKILSYVSRTNDVDKTFIKNSKKNSEKTINVFKEIICPPTFIEVKKDFADVVSLEFLIKENYFDEFSLYIKNLTRGLVILEKKNGRKYIWKNLSPYYLW